MDVIMVKNTYCHLEILAPCICMKLIFIGRSGSAGFVPTYNKFLKRHSLWVIFAKHQSLLRKLIFPWQQSYWLICGLTKFNKANQKAAGYQLYDVTLPPFSWEYIIFLNQEHTVVLWFDTLMKY